jgi:hypothetical protein
MYVTMAQNMADAKQRQLPQLVPAFDRKLAKQPNPQAKQSYHAR